MKGLCILTACLAGVTILGGCSSEEPAGYQAFPQHDPALSETKLPDPPVEIPLVAPKPEPLTGLNAPGIAELEAGMLRPIRLQVPEKKFRTDPKTGEIILSIMDLDLFEVLNMEPVPPNAVSYFPEWMKQLDGKRVQVRGFMVPPSLSEVESFLLARDNAACCMGPEVRIYHLMQVLMKPGNAVEYLPLQAYTLSGTLRFEPLYDDGIWFGLYLLEDAVRRK